MEATQAALDQLPIGTIRHAVHRAATDRLEIFDYPGGYAHRFDGTDPGGGDQEADWQQIHADNQRTTRLRMEQEVLQGFTIRGAGTGGHFLPGHLFTLANHFDSDGDYLVTRVEHTANLEGAYLTGAGGAFDENREGAGPAHHPGHRHPGQQVRSRPAGELLRARMVALEALELAPERRVESGAIDRTGAAWKSSRRYTPRPAVRAVIGVVRKTPRGTANGGWIKVRPKRPSSPPPPPSSAVGPGSRTRKRPPRKRT